MAAGTLIKVKRKAGAFVGTDLAAGELGIDTTNAHLYYSHDGTNVEKVYHTQAGFYREIWVPAAAMTPRTTAGAAPATEEYATNDVMVDYLLFDSVTEEGAQFQVPMPDVWDRGTIKARFYWDGSTGASASDGVTWGIAARAVSNDDAIDAAFSASVDTDDTLIALGDLHTVTSAAVTVSGTPALGDLVWFEVTRVVSDSNDNMAEDAKLFGVRIQYLESFSEPAAW
jgi:hypothetical protein